MTKTIRDSNGDARYLAKSWSWWLLGKFGTFLSSLALMAVFSHFATKELFGQYQYLLSVAAVLSIATLPGLNSAVTRASARGHDGTTIRALKLRLIWGVLGSIVSIGFAAWYFLAGNLLLAKSFAVLALFIPLNGTIYQVVSQYWEGKKRFDKSAYVTVVAMLGISLAVMAAVLLTESLPVIIAAYFIGLSIPSVFLYLKMYKGIANYASDEESIKFGFHLTLMRAVEIAASYVDKILLWHTLGANQLAIYSFAKTPSIRTYQLIPLGRITLPILSERRWAAKELLGRVGRLTLLAIPITILIIAIAPLAYKIIFPQYMESVIIFQVLSLRLLFAPTLILKTDFTARADKRNLYRFRFYLPIFQIALITVLGFIYGLWGIVAGLLIGQTIEGVGLLTLYLVRASREKETI